MRTKRDNKPVIRREQAQRDIEEIVTYYLEQSTQQIALNFVDELEAAIEHIQSFPESGSPRLAHALDLPGLRSWSCKTFPYLLFYFEKEECIDVWRILHQHRDVPQYLQDDS